MDDLVHREGLYYQKFTDVPFTGKVTGEYQGVFNNGKRDGAWVWYHENGQLRSKSNFKNGQIEGAYIRYHKNGQLQAKGNYKNSRYDGTWVWYHEDGTVIKEGTGTYKNDVKISD